MTYRIKPLEWELIKGSEETYYQAYGVNRYCIGLGGGKFTVGCVGFRKVCNSLEPAKAAAQRHHEQQLMKWLEKDETETAYQNCYLIYIR